MGLRIVGCRRERGKCAKIMIGRGRGEKGDHVGAPKNFQNHISVCSSHTVDGWALFATAPYYHCIVAHLLRINIALTQKCTRTFQYTLAGFKFIILASSTQPQFSIFKTLVGYQVHMFLHCGNVQRRRYHTNTLSFCPVHPACCINVDG